MTKSRCACVDVLTLLVTLVLVGIGSVTNSTPGRELALSSPDDNPEVRRLLTTLSVLRRESKTSVMLSVLRAELRRIRRHLKEG